jgi:hypothetical protein
LNTLCKQFPFLKLEDKLFQMMGVLSWKELAQEKEKKRLGAVGLIEFEFGGSSMLVQMGLQLKQVEDGPIRIKEGIQAYELWVGETSTAIEDPAKL